MYLYICTGNLAVIASNPQHELKAGTIRSSIVLSPFISSAATVSSRWLFNGNASAFPSGVDVQGSQVILNSPITGTMRGVYTCEVTSEGGFTATAVYNISVSGECCSVVATTINIHYPVVAVAVVAVVVVVVAVVAVVVVAVVVVVDVVVASILLSLLLPLPLPSFPAGDRHSTFDT